MSTALTAEAITEVSKLAREGRKVELITLDTSALEDGGLPKTVPVLLDTKDGRVTPVRDALEQYRVAPRTKRGTAKATTLASFIDLANRHKTADSVIFATTSWPSPKLTAVIDYHKADGTPAKCEHRLQYDFPITDEFKVWADRNGKLMEQADFAAFLEEHAAELAEATPLERTEFEALFKERFATPADLIELSRNLEIHVGSKVKRGERLSTGERVVEFVEEHQNARGEKVDIPGLFMVSVPAFVDGAPVRIPARLRYRVAGGTISWAFQLYRWESLLRERVKEDMQGAAVATMLPAYEGAPEVGA